jgi:2-C-methyl-D-erythritol 4-phosphate cytidylyltransferase
MATARRPACELSGIGTEQEPSLMPELRNVAVILAGGTGRRMGLRIPKQLVKIAGKPVMQHTLQAFQRSRRIDEIIIAMAPGYRAEAEAIVEAGGFTKVSKVIEGGESRAETTMRAIEVAGPGDETNVLLHDAVRPFVDDRLIEDCVTALERFEAVDVAIPSADTVIEVDDYSGMVIKDVPRRDLLRRGQTPQCFRLSAIRRAYELAMADPEYVAGNVATTDDCSVVLRYLPDVPIFVVTGSEQNIKVTHPVDVFIADKLFQLSSHRPPPPATDEEYAAALSGRTLVIFGGSEGIGAGIAVLARSYGAHVYAFSRAATATDVGDPADIDAALAKAAAGTGRIDYVVDAAGVPHTGRLADADDATVEESARLNFLAPAWIARAALGHLRRTKGHLLLYTSGGYTRGRAGHSLYSSAKAATVNLTQALADEWAQDGVRVNCVNPERTATPMRPRAFDPEPTGTPPTSEQVARTSIDVLISDLTGHVVDVRRQDPAR